MQTSSQPSKSRVAHRIFPPTYSSSSFLEQDCAGLHLKLTFLDSRAKVVSTSLHHFGGIYVELGWHADLVAVNSVAAFRREFKKN